MKFAIIFLLLVLTIYAQQHDYQVFHVFDDDEPSSTVAIGTDAAQYLVANGIDSDNINTMLASEIISVSELRADDTVHAYLRAYHGRIYGLFILGDNENEELSTSIDLLSDFYDNNHVILLPSIAGFHVRTTNLEQLFFQSLEKYLGKPVLTINTTKTNLTPIVSLTEEEPTTEEPIIQPAEQQPVENTTASTSPSSLAIPEKRSFLANLKQFFKNIFLWILGLFQ